MKRSILRLAQLKPQNVFPAEPGQIHHADLDKVISMSSVAPQNIVPGQHITSICQKYDIHFTDSLHGMKGFRQKQPPYLITLQSSPHHCLPWKAMRYFDKFEHPFAKTMLSFYIKRKNEPLWVHCNALGGSTFPNKTATRRLAHAIRDALMAAGYDRFGQRVLVEGESTVKPGLRGSLNIICGNSQAVCSAKFSDLLVEAKRIIDSAQVHLRAPPSRHTLGYQPDRRQSPLFSVSRGAQHAQVREGNNPKRQHMGSGIPTAMPRHSDTRPRHEYKRAHVRQDNNRRGQNTDDHILDKISRNLNTWPRHE
ncbi:hypothetical protein GGS21DRAFT_507167 [Xylaria nigripes]|nr:hypothetical protein GGS21DRAFT_507167 [Xylaria nigripes]